MSTNPVGDEASLHRARAGDASMAIDLAHGARLASLRVGSRELLLGPPTVGDASIRWGCFLMAPWPGRLADGVLRWRGRSVQLRRTHGRHAIHGLVHGAPWRLDEVRRAGAGEVVQASIELAPVGWPFEGRVRQSLSLSPTGLAMRAEVEADEDMPVAVGWHPWFLRGASDPQVRVDADRVLVTTGMLPTGETSDVRGRLDLRPGPHLGARRLDHAYVDVRGPTVIQWPDVEVALGFEPPVTTVVVHTPIHAFCVEPQTAWPNALGSPPEGSRTTAAGSDTGLVDLSGGERFSVQLTLRWRAVRPGPSSSEGPVGSAPSAGADRRHDGPDGIFDRPASPPTVTPDTTTRDRRVAWQTRSGGMDE